MGQMLPFEFGFKDAGDAGRLGTPESYIATGPEGLMSLMSLMSLLLSPLARPTGQGQTDGFWLPSPMLLGVP